MFALIRLSEEAPNTSLDWLLHIVLTFLLLMVVVGWLTSRKKQSRFEVPHEAKKSAKKVKLQPRSKGRRKTKK